MDVLIRFRQIDQELSDWLLSSKAETDEEKELAGEVSALVARLGQLRHELALAEVKVHALDLRDHTKKLEELNKKIEGTAKDIKMAKDIIGTTAEVISIAVAIVGLLSAA
ncbi:MAG: hypothetical protein U0359_14860 [Byssovorax sp.]